MDEPLQRHPIAQIIPAMSPDELRELIADGKAKGRFFNPVTLHEGMVLDGWSRYQGHITDGIPVEFVNYQGHDPLGYVISMNVPRRHLTTAQRKQLAKALLQENPQLSNRAVAKEVGLHHETVVEIRLNGGFRHSGDGVEKTGLEQAAIERVEKTGRKARGRKPLSKAEREAARAQKEIKPKQIANPRDERIETIAGAFRADAARAIVDLAAVAMDYGAKIEEGLALEQRQQLGKKFCAQALRIQVSIQETI